MNNHKSSRGAQGTGTIRQRPDGRWEGRYTIGRDPGTGKQVQKSVYGDTQKEVRLKLQQTAIDIESGIYTEPSRLTVGDWLEIWAAEYLGSLKPNTVEQYRYQIRVHIKPAIGAILLTSLKTPPIQKLYNDSIRKGLSPKSVRNLHGVLHKALLQAMKLSYIRFNPAAACTLPRVEKAEVVPINDGKIAQFIAKIENHRFRALYMLALFTGMRQGEILGLSWGCVDFEKNTITVCKQLQKERKVGGTYQLVSLKNDKVRRLQIAPTISAVLQSHRQSQLETRIRAGNLWSNQDDLVFTNDFGRHLSKVTVYNTFKRLISSIGIPATRFHDMRHTYAVLSLQNGDDLKTVQENLGHATASFTLDVYGHVSERMKQESANHMEVYLKEIANL